MAKLKTVTALLSLTLLTGLGSKMEKFDWLASESAPKDYTMQVVSGDFIYPDGGSLYVPNKSTIHKGWGTPVSSHLVGPELKPLPERLDITFFSYTENAFYQGSFTLPHELILKLFDAGYYSPKEKGQVTYDEIVAGVAPGGVVAVWLYGLDRRTEVFFGHAEKVDIPWERINDNPEYPRDLYVRLGLEETQPPETLEAIKLNGIPYGLWDRYHMRYNWQLDIAAEGPPGLVELITYYNGEKGYLLYPMEDAEKSRSRAIPDYLGYIWKSPEGQAYSLRYNFDEKEIFEAFQQLAPGDEEINTTPLRLETRIEDREDGKRYANAWLHNQQQTLPLKMTRIKIAKTSRWVE